MNLSSRNTGLDLVKAFAILFVLSVHFFLKTEYYSTPLEGKNMYVQTFLRMSFLICVPLFIILTGYLQSNKKPTVDYFKKLMPVLIVYLFYSLVAILVRVYHFDEQKTVLEWLAEVTHFKANSYSWYVNMYIGLFLISPFLNILYKGLNSKRQKQLLILVLVVMTSLPDILNGKARGVLFVPDFWDQMYPLMYYFIGSYLKEYQFRIKKWIGAILLATVTLVEVWIEVHYAMGGKFRGMAGYYNSTLIVVHSVIFFLLFYDVHIKTAILSKFITFVSMLSLDIYLASNISDKIVYQYVFDNIYVNQQQILFQAVPIVLSTFTIAFIMALLRYYILPAERLSTVKIKKKNNMKLRYT
ncbi:acyltransferase [Mesobacillus sp. LC4]